MKKKRQTIVGPIGVIAVFILFAVAMVFITIYISNYQTNTSKYFAKYNRTIDNKLTQIINEQKKMDERIQEVSLNGGYTLEHPCIIENPYQISPLSAVAIFKTEENTSIEVWLNDVLVTKSIRNTSHIIPIYGLYAGAQNNLKFVSESGKSSTVTIQTHSYNFNIGDITIEQYLNDQSHYLILGNLKSKTSYLRGFDAHNNLMYYLDLEGIRSVYFNDEHIFVGYNTNYVAKSNMKDIYLEMDYLGKIISIQEDISLTNALKGTETNFTIETGEFIGIPVDFYEEEIPAALTAEIKDFGNIEPFTRIVTKDIETKLDSAKVYDKKYSLAANGSYLTFDFEEDEISLVAVSSTLPYSYVYNLKGKNNIKTDFKEDVALYIKIGNTYYSLVTIIKNK